MTTWLPGRWRSSRRSNRVPLFLSMVNRRALRKRRRRRSGGAWTLASFTVQRTAGRSGGAAAGGVVKLLLHLLCGVVEGVLRSHLALEDSVGQAALVLQRLVTAGCTNDEAGEGRVGDGQLALRTTLGVAVALRGALDGGDALPTRLMAWTRNFACLRLDAGTRQRVA